MAESSSIKLTHIPEQLQGQMQLPISKSLSNRALVLEHLTGIKLLGPNISSAKDTQLLQRLLKQIDQSDTLDVEDAGTVARFMLAVCATKRNRSFTLSGTDRMHQRPILDLADALVQMGVQIEYLGRTGCLPLRLTAPKKLLPQTEVETSTSSQFLSALLLISPTIEQAFRIQTKGEAVSKPYTQMTFAVLERFGFRVQQRENSYTVERVSGYSQTLDKKLFESDWSAAIYPLLVNGLHNKIKLTGINLFDTSLQGDRHVDDVLKALGLRMFFEGDGATCATIPQYTFPNTVHLDLNNSPDLAQPIIAYVAAKNQPTLITGLSTLKHKETDRLWAMAKELQNLNAQVEYGSDSFTLLKGIDLQKTATLQTHNDHRMAMSFFLLQLVNPSISIEKPEVVRKSFPTFWQELEGLGFKFETAHDTV